jgi:exodeoxyribonuclease VII large subunit
MADLTDEPAPAGNAPEFTVSEISAAVRKVLEGEFPHVRVRGEISRIMRAASGHIYFDLKDENSQLPATIWAGVARSLGYVPKEGDDVVVTGRISAFKGRYQINVEAISLAGIGALLARLDRLKQQLANEGLFDNSRKKAIPYLPGVIGVVTSPTGAVIQDILHRLRERFPVHVLLWPVTVQGEKCAAEVSAAIRGFNALKPGGPIPRPDLLIIARGGGSVEDLWGFNEEIVVRAAAASAIPLISAIGHETDTTLIDFAADLRAPTPTAAAELSVPVRAELAAKLLELGARSGQSLAQLLARSRERLRDRSRALPRPEALLAEPRQRLDQSGQRLPAALGGLAARYRLAFERQSGRLSPRALSEGLARRRILLSNLMHRLAPTLPRSIAQARTRLDGLARAHAAYDVVQVLQRGFALVRRGDRLVIRTAEAAAAPELTIRFQDGEVRVKPEPAG